MNERILKHIYNDIDFYDIDYDNSSDELYGEEDEFPYYLEDVLFEDTFIDVNNN